MRNADKNQFFNKTYDEFDAGFGDTTSNHYWRGLNQLRQLTVDPLPVQFVITVCYFLTRQMTEL